MGGSFAVTIEWKIIFYLKDVDSMLIPINYDRELVEQDRNNIYIFTDNCSRTSGSGMIDHNSWYAICFGNNCKYPSVTTACIRGLDNAYPITTMKRYVKGADYQQYRWTDDDIEEFKTIIDQDFNRIKCVIISKKLKKVYVPSNGFFNSRISNITEQRCPMIYQYLVYKINDLKEFLTQFEEELWN
jgi:hypothetical protein